MALNCRYGRFQANIPEIHTKPSNFQEIVTRGSKVDVQSTESKSKEKILNH